MNRARLVSLLLGTLVLSLVLANTLLPFRSAAEARRYHHFEVSLASSAAGTAQLFYNAGRKFNETDSARVPVAAGGPALLRFRLDAEVVRELRFDPLDTAGTVTLGDAVLRRPDGSVMHRFAPEDFKALHQIARAAVEGDRLVIETAAGANDPYLGVSLGTDLIRLPVRSRSALGPMLARSVPVFLALAALVGVAAATAPRWTPAARRAWTALRGWATRRPKGFIAAAAAAAAVLSSYPVVFLGASYVSPNYGTLLLYNRLPTLPGYQDATAVDARGADVGAIMWQHVPTTVIQSRGYLEHFEFPLWNRYNSAGNPLLGQGQLMVGDPFTFLVALLGGNAWAWDLKYVTAKFLLGFGLGLVVWQVTRQRAAAALVAFAGVFSGFFAFRANHPAFFSFCYGPWVLAAWCALAAAATPRGRFWSAAALAGANAALMTSGTAKEAYVSMLTLNFAGALVVLCAAAPWRDRLLRLSAAAAAGGGLVLVTAPLWLTFLDTVRSSYSSYNETFAYQLQPSLVLGLFDETLLRSFWENERVFNPSASFLVLGGVLLFLANLRSAVRNRAVLGLALGALFPLGFVFGLVPPQWIANWPFFGNIHHIDNSFGVGLIHLLGVLAGAGFVAARARLGRPEGRGDLLVAGLLLFALVFLYLGFTQAVHRSTYTYLHWGETVPRSDFVWGYFASLLAALTVLGIVVHRQQARGTWSAGAGLAAVACVVVLLWKHGLHARSPYPGQALDAAPRADFFARSPALDALRADRREPARAVGLRNNLFPGWNGAPGIEGLNGPDALMNRHVRELQEAFGIERVWDWRLYFAPERIRDHLPFLNLFNTRHVLDLQSGEEELGRALTLVRRADLDLYRNEQAWPRAFFVDRVETYRDPAEFAALVRAAGALPLAAVQAGDAAATPPAEVPRGLEGRRVIPATAYTLTNNSTRFEVEAPGPGLVVLAEAWLPGDFVATVDGREVPSIRVNHAFKGVWIGAPGRHRIAFRYRPRHLDLALAASATGVLLFAAAGWRWGRGPGAAAMFR